MSILVRIAYFYVLVEAPTFISRLEDQEVELESAITLQCQLRGTPKSKVAWMKDGEELTGDRYK